MPHSSGGGRPEVCVVFSGQRQGQIYLCDTANVGPSAHSRHPVPEGCPGNFQTKLATQKHIRSDESTTAQSKEK